VQAALMAKIESKPERVNVTFALIGAAASIARHGSSLHDSFSQR